MEHDDPRGPVVAALLAERYGANTWWTRRELMAAWADHVEDLREGSG